MPADWHGMMKRWIMAMIRCGENSLAMYCFGVLLSFAGLVILTEISSSFAMHAAVGIGGIALIVAAATMMTWTANHDRPGPSGQLPM